MGIGPFDMINIGYDACPIYLYWLGDNDFSFSQSLYCYLIHLQHFHNR